MEPFPIASVPCNPWVMSLKIEALVLERLDRVRLLGPISLHLAPGERLGLVGESGSGKSLLVQAIFGALPPGVRKSAGTICGFGTALDRPGSDRDRVRGAHIAWMPQDPLQALNPWLTVGEHLALLPGVHRRESTLIALSRLAPLLERLGLPQEASFLDRLPHQVSGGQRQRICLAMALSCDPELLILDEPTSALDALTQRAFLKLVLDLQRERRLGFLWISHDPELLAQACDRLLVLYGGEPMEAGPVARVLACPRHPYTARLLEACRRLPPTEFGFLQAPEDRPAGCPFLPRCQVSLPTCTDWGLWRGEPSDGCRCEHPLEPGPRP